MAAQTASGRGWGGPGLQVIEHFQKRLLGWRVGFLQEALHEIALAVDKPTLSGLVDFLFFDKTFP